MNNKYEIRGNVTAIFLYCKGEYLETVIDTADFEKVNEHTGSWYPRFSTANKKHYVMGDFWSNNKRKRVLLHRHLLGPEKGVHVDHINHNTLDNRRINLRLATPMENHQNQLELRSDNKSGVRNVHWDKARNRWAADIVAYKKKIYLGRFDTKEEAESLVEKARALLMPYSQEALQGMDVGELLKPHIHRTRRDKKNGKYRNVYWNNRQNRWQVRIGIDGKERSFGYYQDEEDANKVAEKVRNEVVR